MILCALLLVPVAAPVPSADGVAFFEAKVRPVLIQHCYGCHSETARTQKKLRGGLLLDSRTGVRAGGDSGPIVVPGKAEASLLIKAMRGHTSQMPPKGKLPDAVIADLARWIDLGAPDPRDGTLTAKRLIDLDAGRQFWSIKPLAPQTPPAVKNAGWVRTPIDRFILAPLEARGLAPAAPLAKEKLLRRVTFTLTGLPPTPEDLTSFLADASPGAYERAVDRLLASERYGERWGRHWLDVARFAESGGYEFDGDRPGAFQYRDFVVKALNADVPFDEFVRMQLAGDEMKPGDLTATAATGFLVAGPYPGQTTAKTLEPIRYDHMDDMIQTVGTGLLGLSLGCARCHEHKYDPIPQSDYYRLLANLGRTDSTRRQMDPDPAAFAKLKAAFDAGHAPHVAARDKFIKEQLPARLAKWLADEKGRPGGLWLTVETPTTTVTGLKGITAIRVKAAGEPVLTVNAAPLDVKKGNGAALKLKPVGGGVYAVEPPAGFDGGTRLTFAVKGKVTGPVEVAFTTAKDAKAADAAIPQYRAEVAALAKSPVELMAWFRKADADAERVMAALEASAAKEPKPPVQEVFAAQSGRGGDVHYLIRGETDKKNGVAKPGFAQVLTSGEDARWHKAGTAPRVALAGWITDPKHGAGHLLARVMVNRLWQHHFGRGLVRTPNDFGAQGDAPTHPELLDWLADDLIAGGWKLKRLHRLMVTSAAFLQGGDASPAARKDDPNNRLWSHVPARRLEAEAIRDALLAVGGNLDFKMYGPGTLDENTPRRSVYLTVKRTRLIPFLQAFDAPEAVQSVGERPTTTTTTQALAMMNSPFVRRQAGLLAGRIKGATPDEVVDQTYRLVLGRSPSAAEGPRMAALLRQLADGTKGPGATADFCHVVLCLNEFIYVD